MTSKIQAKIVCTLDEQKDLVRLKFIGDFFEVWSRADWHELTEAHEAIWGYYALIREYYERAEELQRDRNMRFLVDERNRLDQVSTVLVKVMIAYLHLRDTRQSMTLAMRTSLVRRYMTNYFNGGRLHASLHSRNVYRLVQSPASQERPTDPASEKFPGFASNRSTELVEAHLDESDETRFEAELAGAIDRAVETVTTQQYPARDYPWHTDVYTH